jgi:hypothetical protein
MQQAAVRDVATTRVAGQSAPAPHDQTAAALAPHEVHTRLEQPDLLGLRVLDVEVDRVQDHRVGRCVVGTALTVQLRDHPGDVTGRRHGPQARAGQLRGPQCRVVDRRGGQQDVIADAGQ